MSPRKTIPIDSRDGQEPQSTVVDDHDCDVAKIADQCRNRLTTLVWQVWATRRKKTAKSFDLTVFGLNPDRLTPALD
jgi:hypothetical protein